MKIATCWHSINPLSKMDVTYRNALIKSIGARIESDTFPIQVSVPSTKSGVYGIDTTSIFKNMDEKSQIRHTILVSPAGVQCDSVRNARRSDVIVKFVKSLGDSVRVDFNGNVLYFSVSKMPAKVARRKQQEICTAFAEILRHCSTVAKLSD